MDKAHLVGVHEAGIAHHVAAVGEINGQHRPTAMGDGRGAVFVQLVIVVGAHIAARKDFFQMTEKIRVHGHYVFKMAVLGAIFDHQDLAIALDDLRFDLADLFVHQDFVGQLTVNDLLADFGNALGTQRIGAARPA